MSNKDRIARFYETRLAGFEETFQIYDWESEEAHLKRFSVLTEAVDLRGKSLLDLGCGCGDLFGFLKARSIDTRYTGIDLLEKMIAKAKKTYPDGEFLTLDLFEDPLPLNKQFNVVFTSGIFNLNLGNNVDFFKKALPILKNLTKETLVFNLLDVESSDKQERYFYFDQDEVERLLRKEGWRVFFRHDYLGNDFTAICAKSDWKPARDFQALP